MEKSTNLKIPTESNHAEFLTHLQFEDNFRILFSGIFGSGKTTFLKEFFKKYEDSYEVFHIYPVNYQVASNADIFEFIKYDLLFHIVDKGWLPEGEEFSKSLAFQFYLLDKGPSFLLNMLKSVPGNYISKGAESIEKISEFIKGFSTHYDEINKNPASAKVETFLSEMNSKPGSIYELDSISQIICSAIPEKKGGKKSVLIIDDLDRIDPEHIFRILNVFSAHFDIAADGKNKFDFDKIILVCDIQNIRNIFHHRYGSSVDFSGYVDKFYSRKIFTFDLSKEIEKVIDSHIATIAESINGDSYKYQLSNYVNFLVQCFIAAKICTPRDILKFKNAGNIDYKCFLLSSNSDIRNYELLIPIIFDLLIEMVGYDKKLTTMLDKCIESNAVIIRTIGHNESFVKDIISNSALFLFSIGNFIKGKQNFEYDFNKVAISCKIDLQHSANSKSIYRASLLGDYPFDEFQLKLSFEILKESYNRYIELKG